MMNEKSTSKVEKAQTRRYLLEAVPALAITLVPTLVLVAMPSAYRVENTGRILAAVAAVGALLFVFVLVRHVRRADEYQRRALMITFAIGFGSTVVASFCVGLAQLAGWELPAAPWLILGAGMTAWLLATVAWGRR